MALQGKRMGPWNAVPWRWEWGGSASPRCPVPVESCVCSGGRSSPLECFSGISHPGCLPHHTWILHSSFKIPKMKKKPLVGVNYYFSGKGCRQLLFKVRDSAVQIRNLCGGFSGGFCSSVQMTRDLHLVKDRLAVALSCGDLRRPCVSLSSETPKMWALAWDFVSCRGHVADTVPLRI